MKICSLYGAGFYYIPGTDLCVKIGGWVRQQVGYGVNGSLTAGAMVANLDTRATQNAAMRSRGYITADARNQTAYGTVRSYIAVGLSGNPDAASGAPLFSANRAFIQFAGFTFGLSASFYDFYSGPATSFFGGNINMSEDTGDGGKAVTAYTAQFGNGLSASIGFEGQRNAGVITPTSTLTAAAATTTAPVSQQKGMQFPDVVGNLRVDQAWGSAQIMGAFHDASAQYAPGVNTNASPSAGDKWGWAIGAGIKLLAPMIGKGDYFQGQVNYTQGATSYTNNSAGMLAKYNGGIGGNFGFGLMTDNVVGLAGDSNLTTAWGFNAAYEHFWNPSWQTSVYAAYQKFSYSTSANATLCADFGVVGGFGVGYTVAAGCNNNFDIWNIGSRTQWNIDSQTAMGVDIVYQHLDTASAGLTTLFTANGTQAGGLRTFSDQNAWMGQFRIHRNFYP